jgi:bifunctional DNase/RNase
LAITLPAPSLPSGGRSALVIATGSYASPRLGALRAPGRDADDLVAVLADPLLGGFRVTELRDRGVHELRLRADDFLAGRSAEETVLVYLSCHGVLSPRRRLYFAAADTDPDRLASSGLDAHWLIDCLDECRARRQIVILDCCFSGAFALTKGIKGPADVNLGEMFGNAEEARGRIVLTASRATEYSFEGDDLTGSSDGGLPGSVFTMALLEGLRTGSADADHDGFVSVGEAYRYAYQRVRAAGGSQTPQRWLYGGEGSEIVLSRSPAGIVVEPARLHEEVLAGLESRFPRVRLGALETLAEWLTDQDPARVAVARTTLAEIAENDIPLVAQAARSYLSQRQLRELELVGVRVEMPSNSPIVLLKETAGERYLPIWIGPMEATAIAFAQQGMVPAAPLTHDLLCNVLDAVNVQLTSATITKLIDGIFYSDLNLSVGNIVSARPSDAIAIAIRTSAPILAATEVLTEVGLAIPDAPALGKADDDAPGQTAAEPAVPGQGQVPGGTGADSPASPTKTLLDQSSSKTTVIPVNPAVTRQMQVIGVRVEMPSNNPIVLLKETAGERYLPIWIGPMEATAIAFAQQGMVPARPLTHDLFRDVLEAINVRLRSVHVTSITNGVFEAALKLSAGQSVIARPSDAIALALRCNAVVLVADEILDEIGVMLPDEHA